MLDKLHATEGRIDAQFPFFPAQACAARCVSLLGLPGRWLAEAAVTAKGHEPKAPSVTICQRRRAGHRYRARARREISDYGAHNQRLHVTIRRVAGRH
jgi:GTP cyclohydrolase I